MHFSSGCKASGHGLVGCMSSGIHVQTNTKDKAGQVRRVDVDVESCSGRSHMQISGRGFEGCVSSGIHVQINTKDKAGQAGCSGILCADHQHMQGCEGWAGWAHV